MWWRSFFRESVLSCDVRSGDIRMMRLKKQKNHYTILWHWHERVRTVLTSADATNETILSDTLRVLVKTHQFKEQSVIASLPMQNVRLETMHLPEGLKADARLSEMNGYLKRDGLLSEPLCIDFLEKPDQQGYIAYFIAAVRRDIVMQYKALFEDTKLKLAILEVEAYAVLRVIRFYLDTLAAQETHALLYFKDNIAVLSWFQDKHLYFCQTWQVIDSTAWELQLQSRFALFMARFPTLKVARMIVCVSEYNHFLEQVTLEHVEIIFFDLSKCVPDIPEPANDFLIAYGLAMREIT